MGLEVKEDHGNRNEGSLTPTPRGDQVKISKLGSISPVFYTKPLRAQIPKVQIRTDGLTEFLRFLDLHV